MCTVRVPKLRRIPGRGGACWEATIRPSCCTDSRPSSASSTSTADPAKLGRASSGSNCRVRQRYFTVLSRPTLRLYSRHSSGSGTRYAVSVRSDGTRKRSLKRGRKSLSTRLALSMVVEPASLSSVTSLS